MTLNARTLTRITAAVAISIAGLAAAAVPAQAHGAPKPGTACSSSGMTVFADNATYVCTGTATSKPTWSGALKAVKSPLSYVDGWAKAADANAMSASFGRIVNPTNKPITVIAASSPYSDTLQLHEVVMNNGATVMQQKPGGFVIPAGSSIELKPGGNHIMFMKLKKPIAAGAMVPITLITSDGGRVKIYALAKVFSAGNETYNPAASSGMGG